MEVKIQVSDVLWEAHLRTCSMLKISPLAGILEGMQTLINQYDVSEKIQRYWVIEKEKPTLKFHI